MEELNKSYNDLKQHNLNTIRFIEQQRMGAYAHYVIEYEFTPRIQFMKRRYLRMRIKELESKNIS